MVQHDRNAATMPPPATTAEADAAFKAQERLTVELSDHPDPHVRLIAHMSSRQLEMSMRISDLVGGFKDRDVRLGQQLEDINRKLGDMASSYTDLERRTGELELDDDRPSFNGAPAPG